MEFNTRRSDDSGTNDHPGSVLWGHPSPPQGGAWPWIARLRRPLALFRRGGGSTVYKPSALAHGRPALRAAAASERSKRLTSRRERHIAARDAAPLTGSSRRSADALSAGINSPSLWSRLTRPATIGRARQPLWSSRHLSEPRLMSALTPIVFSNSGSGCQALYDHPCRAHCSLRGRGVPSA
jgi:hypothetical protein